MHCIQLKDIYILLIINSGPQKKKKSKNDNWDLSWETVSYKHYNWIKENANFPFFFNK